MPYPFRILPILVFFVFELDAKVVSAQIPVFPIGPKGGAGCRFIIDMDRSLSAGFTAELYASSKVELDIVRIFAKRIYLVYGF